MFAAILPVFSLHLSPASAVVAMSVTNLGILVPSSPGYIGPFHFFCSQALVSQGVPAATAMGYALLVHLTFYIPVTLWGAVSIVWYGVQVGATAALARAGRNSPQHEDRPRRPAPGHRAHRGPATAARGDRLRRRAHRGAGRRPRSTSSIAGRSWRWRPSSPRRWTRCRRASASSTRPGWRPSGSTSGCAISAASAVWTSSDDARRSTPGPTAASACCGSCSVPCGPPRSLAYYEHEGVALALSPAVAKPVFAPAPEAHG